MIRTNIILTHYYITFYDRPSIISIMAPTKTTRTRLRSSSTQPYSLEQCMRTIDDQFRRQRNPSAPGRRERGSTPAGGASDSGRSASENASGDASGSAGDASGSIPTGSASSGEDTINRVAVDLWNQLLYTSEVMDIIGRGSFHMGIKKLLTEAQLEEVMALVKRDIIDRKANFIKTKETDIPKLRLALQEMFTKTVIRHVRGELGVDKENIITRIKELERLDQHVVNKLNIREEAANAWANSIKEAQDGIDTLHERVSHRLDGLVLVDLVVGTPDHTMTLLGELLNNIVSNGSVELPEIIEEERGEDNEEQLIYRSDFDQIPQDVKDYYAEAAKLMLQVTQAKHEENDALADYTLACAKLESTNLQGPKLHDVKTKLGEINEFDELARRIMLEGTFWKYEGIAAPEENDKFHMDSNTLTKAIEELARISKILEDASFENNHRNLEQMVLTAKEYVKKMRSNLPEYSNVAPLTRAVIYTEATIAGCEDVLARITRRTKRTVSHAASTESGRTSSRDTRSQESEERERAKGAGKRKLEDTPDFIDRIIKLKMMKANAALTSTPAGQYTVKKSMRPISSIVGGPGGGGDDDPRDSDNGSDHDDDDDRDEGRRRRDRDDDEDSRRGTKRKRSQSRSRDNGSRRSTSRSRGSKYTTAVPKMPNLDPKNYYWAGNTAFLR